MKALQSCLSRFMNACTDMLEKYDDVRQEEVGLSYFDFMHLVVYVYCAGSVVPMLADSTPLCSLYHLQQ